VTGTFVADLRSCVDGEVRADPAARALYAADASNYRVPPTAVLTPRGDADVLAALEVCRAHGVPVTARGAGTSVAGNAIGTGLVLDFSRHLNAILDVDPAARTATAQPGVVLDDLNAAALEHGLMVGPDPSTHSRCTIGGMIGNNACGPRSVAYGTTAAAVERLDVVCADGGRLVASASTSDTWPAPVREFTAEHLAVIRRELPADFGRRVSGYALQHLVPEHGAHLGRALVGTEGTCAVLLGATLRLVPRPGARALAVLGFPDAIAAAAAVPGILPHRPLTVEGIDAELVALAGAPRPRLPDGGAWLLVEFGADTTAEALDRAAALAGSHGVSTAHAEEQRSLWRLREAGAGLATRMADGREAWPGWEDAAVPPERLADYLRAFTELLRRNDLRGIPYGHFGEGCVHVRIDFDLLSERGTAVFRSVLAEAAELVAAHGGSLSGEHGDGRARSALLDRMYSADARRTFAAFKASWDPANLLNPGVIVDPDPVDHRLRLGPTYRPATHRTALRLVADHGDLAAATRRCVGVGSCRQRSTGVMCPSFRATGEEEHSTRGRARLLFEMLSGEIITDGWRSTEVRDALDLCLGCKACVRDCPVDVDMASYRTEFLHHHYAGRLRPAAHYSMGWLPVLAGLARPAPALANLVAGSRLGKRLAGIDRRRTPPALARRTFRQWFGTGSRGAGPTVLLWPDTFTVHFAPEVGRAAVDVLTAAGFSVRLPSSAVCCGLTWLSTGQLGPARVALRRTLTALRPVIDAGVPVVGLEPSCTALLRTDAAELVPDAAVLAGSVHTLGEFLARFAPDFAPPHLGLRSVSQPHCHQYAVLGTDADRALLAGVVDDTPVPPGCCGMAGHFGFERGHYEVSRACAELALTPAIRAAGPDALVVADGFSCRQQVFHETGRVALHTAEVLRRAIGSRV